MRLCISVKIDGAGFIQEEEEEEEEEAQTPLSSLSQFTSVGFLSTSWGWELSTWTWQLWVWVLESNIAPQYHFCKVVMWPWSDQSQQRMSNSLLLGSFPRVELENWAHEPDSSESECWKVILHPNITFVRWSCDQDLTNHSREWAEAILW